MSFFSKLNENDQDLSNKTKSQLAQEVVSLRQAIRQHRDCRGMDRCWMDDQDLYKILPETVNAVFDLPPKEEFLKECSKYCDAFWENRHVH